MCYSFIICNKNNNINKKNRLMLQNKTYNPFALKHVRLDMSKPPSDNQARMCQEIVRGACVDRYGWSLLPAHEEWRRLLEWIGPKKVLSIGSGRAYFEHWLVQSDISVVCTDIEAPGEHESQLLTVDQIFAYDSFRRSPIAFEPVCVLSATDAVSKYANQCEVLLSIWPPYIKPCAVTPTPKCPCRFSNSLPCGICKPPRYHPRKRASMAHLSRRKQDEIRKRDLHRFILKKARKINRSTHCSCELHTSSSVSLSHSSVSNMTRVSASEPVWLQQSDFVYYALQQFKGHYFILIGEGPHGCTGSDRMFRLLDKKWKLANTLDTPNWDGIFSTIMLYERA
jgi:hypothetical protein